MAKRRRGAEEERLRAAIGKWVRPDGVRSEHKRNKTVAEAIGRPASWVTEYINGQNHANLDTSLALMRFLGWSVEDDLSALVTRDIDPGLLLRLQDKGMAARVRTLLASLPTLEELLTHPPLPKPGQVQSRPSGPKRAQRAAAHTKHRASPHRSSARGKTGT
jgi:hypothetical protein